jgi:hypothetical protein
MFDKRIHMSKAQAGLLRSLAQMLRCLADELLALTDAVGW